MSKEEKNAKINLASELFHKDGPKPASFCPFRNTLTNIAQYLTTNDKGGPGIRTLDHRMVQLSIGTILNMTLLTFRHLKTSLRAFYF